MSIGVGLFLLISSSRVTVGLVSLIGLFIFCARSIVFLVCLFATFPVTSFSESTLNLSSTTSDNSNPVFLFVVSTNRYVYLFTSESCVILASLNNGE